jgi:hypothetical protein
MRRTILTIFLASLGISANAETRYEFSYKNLYDGGWLSPGSGFSGFFVANDNNGDGILKTDEVSDFAIDRMHFVGPQATCDVCQLSLNYTPGGVLRFNSSSIDYTADNRLFFYYNDYSNSGMSWGFDGFYSRSLEVGPETIVTITQVPEPTTYGMLLGGLGFLGFVARKRKA